VCGEKRPSGSTIAIAREFNLPELLVCRGGLGDVEIAEICFLRLGVSRPELESLAAFLGGARAVQPAGLDVKRRAGQVLLALVDKITFDYVEQLPQCPRGGAQGSPSRVPRRSGASPVIVGTFRDSQSLVELAHLLLNAFIGN
jgi:hypothetical protein